MSEQRARSYWSRRVFALLRECGLDDQPVEDLTDPETGETQPQDRHYLAWKLLPLDSPQFSFKGLPTEDLARLVDALHGWHLIEVLRAQRGMVSRPYGGGVADRSVRDAEHHPDPEAHGRAAVSGSGPHSIRNVWGSR